MIIRLIVFMWVLSLAVSIPVTVWFTNRAHRKAIAHLARLAAASDERVQRTMDRNALATMQRDAWKLAGLVRELQSELGMDIK